MQKKFDVIIIGAGTAGLAAVKEVKRHTNSFLLIDHGPLGTTCARVGCMPSKALIEMAHDVHRFHILQKSEILTKGSQIDLSTVFNRVRQFRDSFVRHVVGEIESWGDKFLQGHARFTGPNTLCIDDKHQVEAKSIIIATGSQPLLPSGWPHHHGILTSDNFFDLEQIPQKWAVVGLGPIGLEIGQALAFLGLEVHGYDQSQSIGGLADTPLNDIAREIMQKDMTLNFGNSAEVENIAGKLQLKFGKHSQNFEAILVAVGRKPNLANLDLKKTGCAFDKDGLLLFDEKSMSLPNMPIYLAGDVDKKQMILHEAADDGRIAGYNACHDTGREFERRTPLAIVFTHPGLATVGQRSLDHAETITGKESFEDQGRAKLMQSNQGEVHVHIDSSSGRLIGADLVAPAAEHLAHLLAFSVQSQLTVDDMLRLPFYHPTLEEGLRTALRDAARQMPSHQQRTSRKTLDQEALPHGL